MKIISNIDEAILHVSTNTPNWVQEVYNKTGVWVKYTRNNSGSNIVLINKCGFSNIDDIYDDCDERKEFVSVHTIDDLIDCVINSNSYSTVLQDSKIGHFFKSELFWGIVDFIILPKRSDPQRLLFPFSEQDDYRIERLIVRGDDLEFFFDICGYTKNSGIIKVKNDSEIKECIAQIADQMEEWVADITMDNCPAYDDSDEKIVYRKFVPDFRNDILVPESLNELIKRHNEVFNSGDYGICREK